jgi:hypothetical protein
MSANAAPTPIFPSELSASVAAIATTRADKSAEYVAKRYASQVGNVGCGKSCIRLTNVGKINLETLKKILIEVNDRYVAGEKRFG